MTDDTPTVEEAKARVLSQFIGEPHWIDALIAAVRAEVHWHCPTCGSPLTCSHPEQHQP